MYKRQISMRALSPVGKISAVEAAAVADEFEIETESRIKQMAHYLR